MRMWQQWVNVLLGLWVFVVPFLGMSTSAMTWTLVVSGLVITGLGLWGAQETTMERDSGSMTHRPQHQG